MIRAMTEADVAPLSRLFQKGRRQTFHWVDPSQFALEDFTEQISGEQIWVAEQGGTPCGFIAIWAPDSFVHHLYVSADWHGQGMGRALLEKALAELPRPASLKVAINNTAAIAFYRRLGWEPTEETGLCEVTGPWRRLCLY
ncbi:N-acetyltransferase family protein [Aeromonas rivuli]|jgi:ribosomal protein S18 acetylase RimI-like enzyme|uniref:Acetyltransferase n=1 Tax=Aeromonas molluscorum 848 TaxID=1268236 RepID=R1GQX9_9GAMM|nr:MULTISPECIES: GNAT family N-acetyltransferase [Aeromonas]EOD54105.1 acetyltransferase [Aeromonas molluscorum 848]